MDIILLIFIFPLEVVMKAILEFAYGNFQNYGQAILFLSFMVNTALLPIYYLAKKWKDQDRLLQNQMSEAIAKIKRVYKGQERHYYIQTIYRQFGYHPWMSIKASLGVFIQIPFFFAAFHLLANYEALQGEVFGPISNLGEPDRLLYGINILPILMTVINLLSIVFYEKKKSFKEYLQLLLMALLFLVILYQEPAGLLLYWTTNNLYSLIKNILEKFFTPTKQWLVEQFHYILNYCQVLIDNLPHLDLITRRILRAILVLTTCLSIIFWQHRHDGWNTLFIVILLLALVTNIYICLEYFRVTTKRSKIYLVFVVMVALGVVVLGLDYLTQLLQISSESHLQQDVIILVVLNSIFYFIDRVLTMIDSKLSGHTSIRYFSITTILFLLLLFIINPLALYTSTTDFSVSLKILLEEGILRIVVLWVVIMIMYSISSRVLRMLWQEVVWWSLLFGILYSFIIVKDYGLMDHFIFNTPERLDLPLIFCGGEIALLIALIYFLHSKINMHTKLGRVVLTFISIVFISYTLKTVIGHSDFSTFFNKKKMPPRTTQLDDISNELQTTMAFSPHKNILIFFLDGFSGGTLQQLIDNASELFVEYTGFVRYKNILTTGCSTPASVAALVGGHKYTVEAINSRAKLTLQEEINHAYKVFPDNFTADKWDISYFNPQYATELDPRIHDATKWNYVEHYQKQHQGAKIKMDALFTVNQLHITSLFKLVPLSLKKIIYQQGKWLGVLSSNNRSSDVYLYKIKYWSFMSIFAEKIGVRANKNTLKYFQINIPHGPHKIDMQGELIGKSSYYIEAYQVLKKIGQILHSLKQLNIYDQTKVILVSDHGWWQSNPNFHKSFAQKMAFEKSGRLSGGFVNPILLVKDFKANGKFKSSDIFMSNADVVSIACSSLSQGCSQVMADPLKLKLKHRKLVLSLAGFSDPKRERRFSVSHQYIVKDNVFNVSNWEKVK